MPPCQGATSRLPIWWLGHQVGICAAAILDEGDAGEALAEAGDGLVPTLFGGGAAEFEVEHLDRAAELFGARGGSGRWPGHAGGERRAGGTGAAEDVGASGEPAGWGPAG